MGKRKCCKAKTKTSADDSDLRNKTCSAKSVVRGSYPPQMHTCFPKALFSAGFQPLPVASIAYAHALPKRTKSRCGNEYLWSRPCKPHASATHVTAPKAHDNTGGVGFTTYGLNCASKASKQTRTPSFADVTPIAADYCHGLKQHVIKHCLRPVAQTSHRVRNLCPQATDQHQCTFHLPGISQTQAQRTERGRSATVSHTCVAVLFRIGAAGPCRNAPIPFGSQNDGNVGSLRHDPQTNRCRQNGRARKRPRSAARRKP